MNEAEKPRNILVSSDEVECNMTIKVPGETITMLARQFWRQGSYLRAIQFLMEGVKNIPWHIAIGVLEGRLKFIGDPKITVENDTEPDLIPYAEAIKQSEKRDEENVMHPSYMTRERYDDMRAQEEKEKLAALKESIKQKQALAKTLMQDKEKIENAPPPEKFLEKSFEEFKEESGYDEDIPF